MSSKFIIGAISGAFFGAVLAGIICSVANANHDDPCSSKPKYNSDSSYQKYYNPDDDAAMQFHWQDGQPSLHPR